MVNEICSGRVWRRWARGCGAGSSGGKKLRWFADLVLFSACVSCGVGSQIGHIAPQRRGAGDALADGDRVFCAADYWRGDSDFSPKILLGRGRQLDHAAAVFAAYSGLKRHRANGLQIHHAGSEWMEPRAAFPGGVATAVHRIDLRNCRVLERTFSQRLGTGPQAKIVERISSCDGEDISPRSAEWRAGAIV